MERREPTISARRPDGDLSERQFSRPKRVGVFPNGKVYAVARGRDIGLFETWDAARRSADGWPNAVYKSLPTIAEAKEWLQDRLHTLSVEADQAERNRMEMEEFNKSIRQSAFTADSLMPEAAGA